MESLIIVIHVIVSVALIGLVLIQYGKGAEVGASFGAGASGSVFGAMGAASFLTRMTAACATIFFLTSLTLGYITTKTVASSQPVSLIDKLDGTKAKTKKSSDSDLPD